MMEKPDHEKEKPRARRTRSTSFPFYSLPDSIKDVKETVKYYRDEVNVSALAKVLGHASAKSGSFLQRISSLRNWGFMEGRGEVLTVTNLSRRIANPIDDHQYTDAVAEAFQQCKIFSDILSKLSRDSDLKLTTIGNLAVQEYGVSHKSRDAFVGSFVKSAQVAGLVKDVTNDSLVLRADDDSQGASEEEDEQDRKRGSEQEAREVKREHAIPSTEQRIVAQIWDLPRGAIVFEVRSAEPLSASVYEKIGNAVSAIQDLAGDLGWTGGANSNECANTE